MDDTTLIIGLTAIALYLVCAFLFRAALIRVNDDAYPDADDERKTLLWLLHLPLLLIISICKFSIIIEVSNDVHPRFWKKSLMKLIRVPLIAFASVWNVVHNLKERLQRRKTT